MLNSNSMDENSQEEKQILRGNVITRQELKSLTPKCDANCAITFNILLSFLFLFFGIPVILSSTDIVEYRFNYTNCVPDTNGYCNLTLLTNVTIPSPVYFYYEIHNFNMNHRDFVKSRNFPQLRGDVHVDSLNNSRCEGARYVHEIFDNDSSRYLTSWGKPLDGNDFANPCGLIAKSVFNDTEYYLTDSKGIEIKINDTDIANDYDKEYMFKRNIEHKKLQWIDVEDQHFIVWMQMESFQNFRKLWGKISEDLQPGTYNLSVKNNYNVTRFKGQKLIVLTNSSLLGTGSFFGFILIIAAAISFLLSIVFYILKMKHQHKVYTLNDLKWK